MANLENMAELWKKIADIKIGMFTTTHDDDELHSRPMTALEVDADGCLWFFSSLQSELVGDVSVQPLANLTFTRASATNENNFYVSLSGRAEFIEDRAQYEKLWSPEMKAWFPRGVDDPDLVLIRFRIEDAAYWDTGASRMVKIIKTLTAAVTGSKIPIWKKAADSVSVEPYS